MLNIDDVNLLQSEMVKRSSKGGHRFMFPEGYGILSRKIATVMISLSCSLYQGIPPFVIRYACRCEQKIRG